VYILLILLLILIILVEGWIQKFVNWCISTVLYIWKQVILAERKWRYKCFYLLITTLLRNERGLKRLEKARHYNVCLVTKMWTTNMMQQFSFVDLFESALHVSGDKLAHPQKHFWLYIQLWYNALVGSNTGALYQSCIYSQKCSWGWASLSPETCRADSDRAIKRPTTRIYCILLVAYIVVLMMHGLTNVCSAIMHVVTWAIFSSCNFNSILPIFMCEQNETIPRKNSYGKGKGKLIPFQARCGPEGG